MSKTKKELEAELKATRKVLDVMRESSIKQNEDAEEAFEELKEKFGEPKEAKVNSDPVVTVDF